MHGDDEPVRLGPPRRAVRQVPAPGHARRRRERHEPRRHRGRALAGVAGRQPGAAQRPGAERARRAGRAPARRLGRAATRRGSTPTTTASTTTPGRRSWTRSGSPIADGGDAAGVRRPARRPRQRPRARRPRGRVVRRQGPAHAARATTVRGQFHLRYCGNGSLRRVPRLAVGGGRRRDHGGATARFGARPRRLARAGGADRVHAGPDPRHVPRPRTARRSSRSSSSSRAARRGGRIRPARWAGRTRHRAAPGRPGRRVPTCPVPSARTA